MRGTRGFVEEGTDEPAGIMKRGIAAGPEPVGCRRRPEQNGIGRDGGRTCLAGLRRTREAECEQRGGQVNSRTHGNANRPNVWHQRRAKRVRCMPGLGGRIDRRAWATSRVDGGRADGAETLWLAPLL